MLRQKHTHPIREDIKLASSAWEYPCRCATQAQSEAEAEPSAEDAGNSGAAGAAAEAVDHAGGDGQGAGEEEALLQQSSPSAGGGAQGLERWRGKVALVTGPFLSAAAVVLFVRSWLSVMFHACRPDILT